MSIQPIEERENIDMTILLQQREQLELEEDLIYAVKKSLLFKVKNSEASRTEVLIRYEDNEGEEVESLFTGKLVPLCKKISAGSYGLTPEVYYEGIPLGNNAQDFLLQCQRIAEDERKWTALHQAISLFEFFDDDEYKTKVIDAIKYLAY